MENLGSIRKQASKVEVVEALTSLVIVSTISYISHFYFVYIFFHCYAICTNICYCLLAHIFNPESEYSTP